MGSLLKDTTYFVIYGDEVFHQDETLELPDEMMAETRKVVVVDSILTDINHGTRNLQVNQFEVAEPLIFKDQWERALCH